MGSILGSPILGTYMKLSYHVVAHLQQPVDLQSWLRARNPFPLVLSTDFILSEFFYVFVNILTPSTFHNLGFRCLPSKKLNLPQFGLDQMVDAL